MCKESGIKFGIFFINKSRVLNNIKYIANDFMIDQFKARLFFMFTRHHKNVQKRLAFKSIGLARCTMLELVFCKDKENYQVSCVDPEV